MIDVIQPVCEQFNILVENIRAYEPYVAAYDFNLEKIRSLQEKNEKLRDKLNGIRDRIKGNDL